MSKFKKGDLVIFTSSDFLYRFYKEWADKHSLYKWAENGYPDVPSKGYVVAVGEHLECGERMLYGVAIEGKTYIIGEDSLQDVTKHVQYCTRRKQVVEGLLNDALHAVKELQAELKDIDKELNS